MLAVRQAPKNRLAGYMPPPHGCPPLLIERAFSAMLSLKGDNKEKVGSMDMGARHLHEGIALAGKHPGG